MLSRIISLLRKYRSKKNLKKIRNYLVVGNSHFFEQFSISLTKPLKDKKYVTIGDDTILDCSILFESSEGEVIIGNNVFIGRSSLICRSKIEIEDNVFMAWGIYIYDHNSHSLNYGERQKDISQQLLDYRSGKLFIENKDWNVVDTKPIKICSNAWIGMNCIILKGVTIGEGAVVGAGSVVTKDVPAWSVVGGNPAKVVKNLNDQLKNKIE
ncbi:acyltransferase [Flavobacterium sp.]|uniref:acyltransferase n=1 Tax=Flavobacterium sp. TaxID=239 RepID=UPI00374DC8AB